jgi:protein-S-isoprenylcysteine O-methyltransferase Ste14
MLKKVKLLNDYLLTSIPLLGRNKTCRVRQALNLHKLAVAPIYLVIIYWNNQTLQTIPTNLRLVFLLHTIYGMLWVIKDIHFPDYSWQSEATLGSVVNMFFVLSAIYYSPVYCQYIECPDIGNALFKNNEVLCQIAGIFFYVFGIFFHFVADAQKFFILKYRQPRSLITNGLFKYTRNPNYFGEVLIYVGYAFLSGIPFTIVLFMIVWVSVFLPNIACKDERLSRHKGFDDYIKKTGLLIPSFSNMVVDLKYVFMDLPNEDGDESKQIKIIKKKKRL